MMHFQFKLIPTVLSIILLSCGPVESANLRRAVSPITALGRQLMDSDNQYVRNRLPPENTIRYGFRRINDLASDLKLPKLEKLAEELGPYVTIHGDALASVINDIYSIETLYERFQRYTSGVHYETDTIESFSTACVSSDFYLLPIDPLHELIKPTAGNSNSIFNLMFGRRSPANSRAICNTTMSVQQQVHRLYNYIAITMVKGHVMKLYAYHLLKQFDNQTHTAEMNSVKQNFTRKMQEIEGVVWNVMHMASRDIRPCDPKIHQEGVTYMQLKWLFGYVAINEIYLNPHATCSETCEYYQQSEVYPRNWPTPPQHSCQGNVYQCFKTLYDSYCPATEPYRRYDGFKEYHRTFKENVPASGNASCPGYDFPPTTRPNPEVFSTCDECVCVCDDLRSRETVRTFSTRRVTSDTDDNRVITGLRLVEKKRVIHIQIQDGKLGPYGTVNESTVRWKDVEEFDYRDPSVPKSDYFTISKGFDKLYFRSQQSWPGFAVTGIQFLDNVDGISLGVAVTPIEYLTGRVKRRKPGYSSRPNRNWRELTLKEPHIPILAKQENIVNTNADQYLRFRQTDWLKDSAQTAIPFIDIQSVVSNPPSALSGVGMFYKGVPGYGGFLGMKLITYNHKSYVDSSLANPLSAGTGRDVQ